MDCIFEYYIETDKLHLKYAKGEPSVKESEFHNYNELVFFIEGNSFLISKNIQQQLVPGSLVLIPKEHFHQFLVSQPDSYVRLILGFRETNKNRALITEVMNMIKVLSMPDDRVVSLFYNLIEIIKSDLSEDEKKLFIGSSIVQLMIFLKRNSESMIKKSLSLTPIVSSALSIIDEKYAENLSVDKISKILCVSPSTLAHKFSRELNISVYRYITKKRLSVAHELIRQGEPLTSAALSCGFSDYSCFYRLYKKYY